MEESNSKFFDREKGARSLTLIVNNGQQRSSYLEEASLSTWPMSTTRERISMAKNAGGARTAHSSQTKLPEPRAHGRASPEVDARGQDSRKRIQIDFSGPAYEKLVDLRERLDASTNAEVVRRALNALELILDQQKAGRRVLFYDGDKLTEVVNI